MDPAAFAQSSGIEHFVIKTKPGQKAVSATHHIQNINSPYSRYKDFTGTFKGSTSKYPLQDMEAIIQQRVLASSQFSKKDGRRFNASPHGLQLLARRQ